MRATTKIYRNNLRDKDLNSGLLRLHLRYKFGECGRDVCCCDVALYVVGAEVHHDNVWTSARKPGRQEVSERDVCAEMAAL